MGIGIYSVGPFRSPRTTPSYSWSRRAADDLRRLKYAYHAMLFSTPFIGCAMLFSLLYIFFVFFVRPRK